MPVKHPGPEFFWKCKMRACRREVSKCLHPLASYGLPQQLEVYNFRDVMHVDLREYSFLSNWLLRSGIYGNSQPLVFKIGNLFLLLCMVIQRVQCSLCDGFLQGLPQKLDFLACERSRKYTFSSPCLELPPHPQKPMVLPRKISSLLFPDYCACSEY